MSSRAYMLVKVYVECQIHKPIWKYLFDVLFYSSTQISLIFSFMVLTITFLSLPMTVTQYCANIKWDIWSFVVFLLNIIHTYFNVWLTTYGSYKTKYTNRKMLTFFINDITFVGNILETLFVQFSQAATQLILTNYVCTSMTIVFYSLGLSR